MGHMNILLYLIQHGAGIDTTTVRGETALHLAARANQTDVMRVLLRNGAQVDARARVCTITLRQTSVLRPSGLSPGLRYLKDTRKLSYRKDDRAMRRQK